MYINSLPQKPRHKAPKAAKPSGKAPPKAYSEDPTEYVATVLNRLAAEPFGLGLALFLAILFGVPSQIPDMVDPFFSPGGFGIATGAYVICALWMGYTVWFWMVAAIRAEALIPGGRYYMPRGAHERGYVPIFGAWYRPFNFAANFAAVLAFLACMSRPLFLTLDWSAAETWRQIATPIVFWVVSFAIYRAAFARPTWWQIALSLAATAGVFAGCYAIMQIGLLTIWCIATSAVLIAFASVWYFDTPSGTGAAEDRTTDDVILKFKREELSEIDRFSPLWNTRATALLLATPHRLFPKAGEELSYMWLRQAMWLLHVFGPVLFLIWLLALEGFDWLVPLPTPVITLLAMTMSIGPLVVLLSILRDGLERLLILLFANKTRRGAAIRTHREQMRKDFPADPPSEDAPGKIETLAYGAYYLDGAMNVGTRVFARAAALIAMGVLFFTNALDTTHAAISPGRNTGEGPRDLSHLSYHIAPVKPGDAAVSVDARPPLADALTAWHAARPDLGRGDVPVVIVAASGGANRASVWSMAMLRALNEHIGDDRFDAHLFAISGVSGGSLGAVTYAFHVDRALTPEATQLDWPLPQAARRDLLSSSIAYFFNVDLLRRFDFGPMRMLFSDRNEILERTFERAWRNDWQFSTVKKTGLLAAHTASNGRMPHLLLNGVDSRSGRRVMTSTLDMNAGQLFPETQDFFDTFGSDIRPATAVMNSARFPLISPTGRYLARETSCDADPDAACLDPKYQIIDGGYYENSGVQTAFELARAITSIADDIAATKGWRPVPVIVAISNQATGVADTAWEAAGEATRFSSSQLEGRRVFVDRAGNYIPRFDQVTPVCGNRNALWDGLLPDSEDYATELSAILRGLSRTGASHNHRSLRIAMAAYCPGAEAVQRFFHFGLPRPIKTGETAPMNWVLSQKAVTYMTKDAPKTVLQEQRDEVDALRRLFAD